MKAVGPIMAMIVDLWCNISPAEIMVGHLWPNIIYSSKLSMAQYDGLGGYDGPGKSTL